VNSASSLAAIEGERRLLAVTTHRTALATSATLTSFSR
jgi:hypothetical protein